MKVGLAISFAFILLILSNCSLADYQTEISKSLVVHTIIDPEIEMVIFLWKKQEINVEENIDVDSSFLLTIFQDQEAVYTKDVLLGQIYTGIYPQIGSRYTIQVSNDNISTYNSNEFVVMDTPMVLSHFANDSIKNLPNSTQVIQEIGIQVDTLSIADPYFAYKVTSDSSALFDWPDTIKTEDWEPKTGTFCPEIAAPVFFEGNYRILNLSCQKNQGLMTFQSMFFRPDEYQYMNFTICNIDDKSIDLLRQSTQNGLYESFKYEDNNLNAIFATKDDFLKVEEHYELVLNRSCIEYKIEY